jgi:hypothetical protein
VSDSQTSKRLAGYTLFSWANPSAGSLSSGARRLTSKTVKHFNTPHTNTRRCPTPVLSCHMMTCAKRGEFICFTCVHAPSSTATFFTCSSPEPWYNPSHTTRWCTTLSRTDTSTSVLLHQPPAVATSRRPAVRGLPCRWQRSRACKILHEDLHLCYLLGIPDLG